MNGSSFDPAQAVTFDLTQGQVRFAGETSQRSVLVPASVITALASAAGSIATLEAGRDIGKALGARVAARFAGTEKVREGASLDVVAELANELAIAGFGRLEVERWGRALVLTIAGVPASTHDGRALVAAIVEGMLGTATHRELRTAVLRGSSASDEGGAPLRLLVGNPATIERVTGWLEGGVSWGDALTRLHAPAPVPGGAEASR